MRGTSQSLAHACHGLGRHYLSTIPATTGLRVTGAEVLHNILRERGVEKVFGYPGGAILPLFDAIFESPHFQFILPRHEQGGGHMAEGYARRSGKPGVVVVTSGPGATNVVTPMQDALMDGTPMVVFSGQVPRSMIGLEAFQEADVVGISRSCTKWNVQVNSIQDLPRYVNQAFDIATSGRPGPVLVDLPKDITAGSIPADELSCNVQDFVYRRRHERRHQTIVDKRSLEQVVNLLNKAKRPVIYAGQGVIQAGASDLLRQLAFNGQIPVTTTLLGMGVFDECHPLSLRMLGMHGNAAANLAIQDADLILAVGARFDDRVTGNLKSFAPAALQAHHEDRGGIVHFEVLPKNMNKIVQSTITVVGDLKLQLEALLKIGPLKPQPRADWLARIANWEAMYPFYYEPGEPGALLKPQRVIEELYRQVAHRTEDVIITTGVGCHQMWAAQFYRWRHPRSFITSGGLGTMGFGLPAAIGASLAAPDKLVVDIDGDASFMMTMTELATAAQYKIPVKVLLLNNSFQGMVKQWQDLFYDERYSHTIMHNPNFAKLAEAMNVKGLTVNCEENLPQAIAEMIAHPGPVVLDAKISAAEHVYPMVPAGAGLHEMRHHPKLNPVLY